MSQQSRLKRRGMEHLAGNPSAIVAEANRRSQEFQRKLAAAKVSNAQARAAGADTKGSLLEFGKAGMRRQEATRTPKSPG
jgi:hypothetical protein